MGQRPFSHLLKHRGVVGAAGLAVLVGALAVDRIGGDNGISAEDITQEFVAEAQAELSGAPLPHTGAYVLDFVEPEDGEGGSEAAIAARVDELDARPDIEVETAGFYSEGEHLYMARPEGGASLEGLPELLADDPLVEGYEPEIFYSLPDNVMVAVDDAEIQKPPRAEPNDPMFPLQWHMEQIHAAEAWPTHRGSDVVVAVIDTGVAYKDYKKQAKQVPDLAGTKFTKGKTFCSGLPDGMDDNTHGTHVAGTIAQTTNNNLGVTGVSHDATIMPLKVLTKDGRGSVPGIANAIRYAADNGAHVINMSLGGPLPSRVLAKAIEYAHGKGVTTVCAAGNERRSKVGYPAANQFAVAVSATDFSRDLTFYSNWGEAIDVAAPGGDTRSDKNGDGHPDGVLQNTIKPKKPLENDYMWFQGTSMASPHGAGVAALIVSTGITNPDEVERVMKATADHPRGVEWDERYGAGIINAQKAVNHNADAYAPARGGFAGLLALLGLVGLGLAGARRGRGLAIAGLVGGVVLASGVLGTTPIAYALAGLGSGLLGFGSPLWMSAAVPAGLTLLLLGVKPARGLLIGLCLGYAAVLAHSAVVLPTVLTELPGGEWVDRLWLALNAGIALWLARRVGRAE